jgi:glycosyltransferase involved in cell wall biosynthesis
MYPPHHLGGYELVWRSAVRHHRSAGHDVRVLTTDVRFDERQEPDDPACFRELRWYWRGHAWPRLSLTQRARLEHHNVRTLRRHLDDFRPDVVAWWAMGGLSLSLPGRVDRPSAAFVMDDWLAYGPREDQWGRLLRRRRFPATRIDHWVFVSGSTRARAQALGHVFASSEVNPSGVGAEFLVAAPQQAWSWRLLYVGRIDERKGIDTAIRALDHLPAQARLDVVGAGDRAAEQRLRAIADERVRFRPNVAREQLPAVYAGADAVVFPVRWNEPWGLVPLEAMGIGRPVVATGRGGSGEYLRDGVNTLLFDAEEPAALASQVTRLAGNEALRLRLTTNGRHTAEHHSAAAHDARATEVLEQLARHAGRHAAPRSRL